MADPINLQVQRSKGRQEENEKLAQFFEEAVVRARAGEFKSACWIAWGRDGTAQFGWQKFGSIIPLIGAVTTVLRDMGDSPHLQLDPLHDPDDGA
jgi:uncharacterized protein YecE (DUF72 family)